MNWKKKLSSRKLWAAAVGIIVGLAAAFGIEENEYAQIVGIVGSIVSAVSYIFGEAKIDAAASVPIIIPEIESENPEESQDECL